MIFYIETNVSSLLCQLESKVQRLFPSFRGPAFNRAMKNNVGCNQKPEFQYGGHQTGNTHISAPLGRRNEIPTATCTISGSSSQ